MGKMMTIKLSQEDANRILLALEIAEEKVLGPGLATITSKELTECIRASRLADKIFDAGLDAGFGQKVVVVKEYSNTKVTSYPKMFSDDVTHCGDSHAIG